ncbi:unannotated protein [freshwater metagenome]|uniref:Unannotated protein n=1 Tax=freshwater metagenome TaxID=449393 RepID=A0A6J6SDK4_9ZZZZ
MLVAPTYHPVKGGISQIASALSMATMAETSLRQKAST